MTEPKIPANLRELYDAAKGVEGSGLPIPYAADRVIELIEIATDMHAALKTSLTWIRHWQEDVGFGLKPTPLSLIIAETTLEEAIAKAEGRND
jgi:translation elongation factor EF-1beta